MFHHVVLIKFNAPLDASAIAYINKECETMRNTIPGLRTMMFVENVASRSQGFTHAFESTFDSSAAHDQYQIHPAHVSLKQFITPRAADIIALDHEC